ncbi:MAG: polymorphic toxin type 17 domain-containing protein [Geminicoccaceae bacterium]
MKLVISFRHKLWLLLSYFDNNNNLPILIFCIVRSDFMFLGGLTGASGGSIAGTAPPPSQKQPDLADLSSYARSGPTKTDGDKQSAGNGRPDGDWSTGSDSGLDVPTDEQSRRLQDFDAVRGRHGNVQVAQASVGTMTDATPEMAGNAPGTDSTQIRLERGGQAEGGAVQTIGNIAKKGAAKAGGVIAGIVVPTNSSHDETLTIPGQPQYRITGKESELNRTLEVQNADGSWEPIGRVAVTRGGVDQAAINEILKDRGFEPIDPLPTSLPGTPTDGPKGPTILSTPDQGPRGADIVSTPNDGPRGADVLSTPIPEKQAPQIVEARNTKLDDKLNEMGLPTEGDVTFDPGKRTTEDTLVKNRGEKHGYLDQDDNEWNWDKGKNDHWDVTLSDAGKRKFGHLSKSGTHINITPDGRIAH